MQKANFNLISLVVILVLLGLLIAVLVPAMSCSMEKAVMAAVAARGRDIYVAITSANFDREPLGLPPVWPQSNPPTLDAADISKMNFTNSTDYFWELYDGVHLGTTNHDPYVRGFDFSKLAGAGVPAWGEGRLRPRNNLWSIAKNVPDKMDDIIPVLVTRNVAAESLASDVADPALLKRRLYFDQEWRTPFGKKGFVFVRKGGGIFSQMSRYMTYRSIYNSQASFTPRPDSKSPHLSYLTPNKEVIPSEAVYQAYAPSFADRWNDCVKDVLDIVISILPGYLFIGLFAYVFIRVFVHYNGQSKAQLSVMGPGYWLLLWLSVTTYICGLLMLIVFVSGDISPVLVVLTLVTAVAFQYCSYLTLLRWKRRTGNLEVYQTALALILKAPLIALPCLVIVALFSIFP